MMAPWHTRIRVRQGIHARVDGIRVYLAEDAEHNERHDAREKHEDDNGVDNREPVDVVVCHLWTLCVCVCVCVCVCTRSQTYT